MGICHQLSTTTKEKEIDGEKMTGLSCVTRSDYPCGCEIAVTNTAKGKTFRFERICDEHEPKSFKATNARIKLARLAISGGEDR